MHRPARFEDHRWLGDKRTQVVYDVDACREVAVIDDLVASGWVATFAPDTLAEARNRGYRVVRPEIAAKRLARKAAFEATEARSETARQAEGGHGVGAVGGRHGSGGGDEIVRPPGSPA